MRQLHLAHHVGQPLVHVGNAKVEEGFPALLHEVLV